jgi:sec-independent protein translocase protein TatC
VIDHRFLIRYVRHAIVGIFIVAAILTPPDVLSQILLAMPLLVLYAISILIAYLSRRNAGADGNRPALGSDNKIHRETI